MLDRNDVTVVNPDRLLRLWRLRPWHENTLTRRSDKVVSLVAIATIVVVLALIPVSALFGSSTYLRLSAESARDRSSSQLVDAYVVDTPVPQPAPTEFAVSSKAFATVRWSGLDNTVRSGRVEVLVDTQQGQQVPVWVNDSRELTHPPRTGAVDASLGVSAGLGLWVVCSAIAISVLFGVWAASRRSNLEHWDAEWRSLEEKSEQ